MNCFAPTAALTLALALGSCCQTGWAQTRRDASLDTPMTRLRPIGSASAVDRYRRSEPASTAVWQETSYVRQAAMQNYDMPPSYATPPVGASAPDPFAAPELPADANPSGYGASPGPTPPSSAAPSLPMNPSSPSRSANPPITTSPPATAPAISGNPWNTPPSSSDLAPMTPPQLSSGFATINNCCQVSAASTYSAASGTGCGQSYAPPAAYAPAPGYAPVAGAAVIAAPQPLVPGAAAPHRPLITLGQDRNLVQVGQAIIGQPKAYVPGQAVRNWLRYFTP